jgi:pantetheine-phosphate adenylyltransferase
MNVALFPGSFDPITKGHESIINKALLLFDIIYIGIGYNQQKKYCFSLEQRKQWLTEMFKNNTKIKIVPYMGLTAELCEKFNIKYIIRGLRNTIDFEYEKNIAYNNKLLNNNIETLFILPEAKYLHINSTLVREIYQCGGKINDFLPENLKIPEIH